MLIVSHLKNNAGLKMVFIANIYNFEKQTTNNRLHPLHKSLGRLECHWFPIMLFNPDNGKIGY